MTPYLIAGGGLVLSVAAAIAAVSRLTGKLEHRVSTVERDTERLRVEKVSTERVDGLQRWLDERFRSIESLIRHERESSGAYRPAPGGE